MKVTFQPINRNYIINPNFKSNITIDIGGSQREGSRKTRYSATNTDEVFYTDKSCVNELGKNGFENKEDFIRLIVDKIKKEEGKTKEELGREEFLKRAWAWKEEYGNRIVEQQKKEFAYIEPQAFSVEGKMEDILQRLEKAVGGIVLSDFFLTGHRAEKIASFLGLLELLKAGRVIIEQKEPFAPIYIFVRKVEENGI